MSASDDTIEVRAKNASVDHDSKEEMATTEAVNAEFAGEYASEDELPLRWVRTREYCLDFFSEFLGTMILLLFGDGVVAQVVLSKDVKGDYQSISWGWG